jgi:methionyl-tRNA synthetase
VTYVWADALNNYITGVGYGQEGKQADFKKWWPADMQVLGKDIVRFHAVYWPAFLMASGLPLPKQLLVHGWIKMGDYKMSKSRGNSIDPQNLLQSYGADAVRYYLTRQLAITQDGQFSIEDLEQKISSDLANDLGNLLQRTESLALKI